MYIARHLWRSVVLSAVLAASFISVASATLEFTGDVHTTFRTGYPGTAFVLGDPYSTVFAIWGLSSMERSDNPCWVKIYKESMNNIAGENTREKSLCGSQGPKNDSFESADFADGDFTGEKAFVTGVSVCMNRDETKVKGWRLYGKGLTDSGQLVALATYAWTDRPNCHEWQPRVDCPAGQLATAAEIHYGPGTEPRSWIGIALKCRAIMVVP